MKSHACAITSGCVVIFKNKNQLESQKLWSQIDRIEGQATGLVKSEEEEKEEEKEGGGRGGSGGETTGVQSRKEI